LVASSDPHSAVTLEQLLAVVQGETSDTIVSVDLASRVKCQSDNISVKVNSNDAFALTKPSQTSTRITLANESAGMELVSSSITPHILALKGGSKSGVSL
jgi:hypothetical protein